MKVLILNHQHVACGVYQFAKRIHKIASRSNKIQYIINSVKNREEYLCAIENIKPNFIVYNWHWDRMPWLLDKDVSKNPSIKHYFIYHDGSMFSSYDKYLFFGDFDPNKKAVSENKRVLLPRPLFDYDGPYPNNALPTIGSFGFGFNHKKFHTLVQLVNRTIPRAVINLHLTLPYFGDTPGNRLSDIINLCNKYNRHTKVKLNISTNFLDDDKLLEFLAKNDINVFSYEGDYYNPGLSSATDYALSVKRPIAISNNIMFRHIMKKEICLNWNSIMDILRKGTTPLDEFYDKWSTDRFSQEFDNLFLLGES